MITTGSKWYFGLGFVTLVLAWSYGWSTGGNGLGPLSVGYKGGVGDHFGYGVLLTAAVLSLFLGFVATAVRDAEAQAVAQVAGTDTVPAVTPAGTSYWPAVTAFGVALVVIGLVSAPVLFVFGLIVLGIVLVEWTVQTWADRATGDPAANREIRNRVMNPIEFPAAGLLGVAVLVVSISRVFLAVSADQAVWIATGAAAGVTTTTCRRRPTATPSSRSGGPSYRPPSSAWSPWGPSRRCSASTTRRATASPSRSSATS